MSYNIVDVTRIGKRYEIYSGSEDRLKQFFMPRLQRLIRIPERRYFNEFWALHDISFSIRPGETVGIVGKNGSGKSTLLQIIAGTLQPTVGSVSVRGRIAALLELGSGFNPEFTGRENVFLNASVLGLTDEEIRNKYDAIVSFSEIGSFIDQPTKFYSSGMLTRLAFAVVAHVDADVLIVDEALAVGDAYFTQKCMRFLRKFMERGTLLFVSHDEGAVLNLCNKAILLHQGNLIDFGETKSVIRQYHKILYGGAAQVEHLAEQKSERADHQNDRSKDEQSSPNQSSPVSSSRERHISSGLASQVSNNPAQVFEFCLSDQGSTGSDDAEIIGVFLRSLSDQPDGSIHGGDDVELKIIGRAKRTIVSPIFGFQWRDRLSQVLFGSNTFQFEAGRGAVWSSGSELVATFVFRLPFLPVGDYAVTVAVAEGTQTDHVQLHWVHEALIVKVLGSYFKQGLVGISMKSVSLEANRSVREGN